MRLRQEVLNVLLAELLQERGLVAVPEQVVRRRRAVKLPDVIVDCQGLRLAIEAEYATSRGKRKGTDGASRKAFRAARQRVDQAVAHVGIAVVYPEDMKSVSSFDEAKQKLQRCKMSFTVVTEPAISPIGPQKLLFPDETIPEFMQGTVDDLAESLRRFYEQLVKDETLERAVAVLEASIEACLDALRVQPATSGRLARVLSVEFTDGKALKAKERNAVNRITALILVNAMIFQEVLAQQDARVQALQRLRRSSTLVNDVRDHWQFIVTEINYYPIFSTACELMDCFAADEGANRAFGELVDAALKVVTWKASLRHDLAGRIYHRLLDEAKYLGAYYTSIPAAALLLKLALAPSDYNCDWSDPEAVGQLHVGDLACGTGTLLMAAADTIVDNYVRACVQNGTRPDLQAIHRCVVERVIYGYDVLSSAVHLTASTLTLRIPDTPIDVTHLYRVPLGGPGNALGTLEFLDRGASSGTLFGLPEQVTGGKAVERAILLPKLDVCTMNPPFTSSRQPNLLFGNVIGRESLQKKLKKIVREQKLATSITAGLGAVFVALGDRQLKPNGRLALVLPRSILNGVAWEKNRRRIARDYQLEYVLVSHEPDHWNFSENTELSEAMVVARKRAPDEAAVEESVVFVNFWQVPRTAVEALGVASALREARVADIFSDQGCMQVDCGMHKLGEAIAVPWGKLRESSWSFPCAFAQSELIRIFYKLMDGTVCLPGQQRGRRVKLTPLCDLADLGPDPRDVYDGFDLVEGPTPYRALWGHSAESVTTMHQTPNQYLSPLSRAKKGRPLRKLDDLWPKAGRVLIAQRPWMKTKSVMATRVNQKVLGDVWCPLSLKKGLRAKAEKALTLWFNSTLGVLLLLGHREETRGAWIQFKKPQLRAMPVLDLRAIGSQRLDALAIAYDRLAHNHFEPFPEMAPDQTRSAVDKALGTVLRLPDFAPIRSMLALEPVICVSSEGLRNASEHP